MNNIVVMTAAGLMLTSVSAMAQAQSAATQPSSHPAASQAQAMNATPLRKEMADSLGQAGFTDIKVVPDSFFVQAKDKSGNPVAMLIGPNSVTEMTDVMGGNGAAASGQNAAATGGFVTNTSGDTLTSKLVGATVRNDANQDIGTVKDVAMRNGRVQAYILSVGGFLGMGEHYVAVAPSALSVSHDAASNTTRVSLDTTEAKLKAAPEFKYANT